MNILFAALASIGMAAAVTLTPDGQQCVFAAEDAALAHQAMQDFASRQIKLEEYLVRLEAIAPLWCFDMDLLVHEDDYLAD